MRYAVVVLLLASPALAAEPPRVVVVPQPSSQPQLRGPLRIRLGTAMGNVIADTTMKVIEEIPKAVVDSVKRGDFKFSFSASPQPPAVQVVPPAPIQPAPAPSPQRRGLLFRR